MKKITTFFLLLFFVSALCVAQNRMTPERLWEFGRVSDEQVSPDGKSVLYGITYYDLEANKGNRQLYTIPVEGGESIKITNLTGSAYNARWRPDGKKIGYLSVESGTMQLWEINPDGTEKRQVTNFEESISNFAYSPTMEHISFSMEVKLDSTVHDKYPHLDQANAMIFDDLMYRHWDEWSDDLYSHVFYASYDTEAGKVKGDPTDIMEGEKFDSPQRPFGGIEDIAWSADGKTLAYVAKKVSGKEYAESTNSDIYLYDLESGTTKNLTEGMLGYDTHPVFSPGGNRLAWLSMERAGFESDKNVLHIYDFLSGRIHKVTDELDASVTGLHWSSDGKKIYLIAGVNATYQIYELNIVEALSRKKPQKLTDLRALTAGEHNYNSFAVAGNKFIIGHKNTISMPAELFRINIKKADEQQLTFTNQTLLEDIQMGDVKKRMVKTTDGKDMLAWVIYPPNFDPNKKYPALLYCQGGPQSAVSQFFSYRWNFQLMAANDYIIIAPNRRGLPTFGQEWNDAISKDWGGQAMKDYLSAIDDLAQEPYVDEERLGAVGASYGGYSVYYLAGIHEGRFKALVSHAGLFNLTSWYGTTEEMFFANWDVGGPYWDSTHKEAYETFSPHKFVQNWDTPILVIHGQKDYRVPVSQGMEAFNAAQLRGIPSKFLYYPDEGHWVLGVHNGLLWHSVFFEWLDKYLK